MRPAGQFPVLVGYGATVLEGVSPWLTARGSLAAVATVLPSTSGLRRTSSPCRTSCYYLHLPCSRACRRTVGRDRFWRRAQYPGITLARASWAATILIIEMMR